MANSDDTVIIRPPRARPRSRTVLVAALLLSTLTGLGAAALLGMRGTAPPPTIPLADEAALRAASPAARTALRFALNPAIVVLDFPTLEEQGRMLNRLAAWAEKAGVPHDRLLSDAELDAAIRSAGATPATYYYGHDYAVATIARFFATADRDHVPLNADEQSLRLVTQAAAAPPGFGALITLVRADAANDVDPSSRAVILHHELSHGEYFTNPAYASFVKSVWDTTLTKDERAAFRRYLATEGYDPALEDVMMNEMQAYLMHTPDRRFFEPARITIAPDRLAQIERSFLAGMPPGWLRDATAPPPLSPRVPAPRRVATPRQSLQGRVSRRTAAADTLPPRRRRLSAAA